MEKNKTSLQSPAMCAKHELDLIYINNAHIEHTTLHIKVQLVYY